MWNALARAGGDYAGLQRGAPCGAPDVKINRHPVPGGGPAQVSAGATGVFGIRLSPTGDLQALAASELRFVRVEMIESFGEPIPKLHLKLPQPVDLALWQGAHDKWHGVIQGDSEIPQELFSWTRNWMRMDLAPPKNAKR